MALQFYCKPQIFYPLILIGETLPAAPQNLLYTQDISGQAFGGVPPYTFSLISASNPTAAVSATGVITEIPISGAFFTTETGVSLTTETGSFLTS